MQARRRQYLSGGLVTLLGLAVTLEARSFGLGTMARTGPGFFPLVLGGALTLVGVLIALTPDTEADTEAGHGFGRPDWRGWGCILAGVLAFIVLGEEFGLAPASFACVFIAAWGDRGATLRGSLLLAAAATVVAAVVFAWALKFQLPLFRW
ncbi:MAG: tripartite tricarboxylate transporter TctB family protein [Janthinobacterium lividum]